MPHQSDPRFLVLHASKLKGFAEPAALAGLIGMKPKAVEDQLKQLASGGFVMHREGRVSGWMLTPEGRAEHAKLLTHDVAKIGAKKKFQAAYDEFLHWNGELLAVCSAWQMKDVERHVENDHTDRWYDKEVLDRLKAVHAGVTPIIAKLKALALRYDPYSARLKNALDKLGRGDRDWFAKPMIDSYHTVWMELHEDLLESLKIERSPKIEEEDDEEEEFIDTRLAQLRKQRNAAITAAHS